MWQSLEILSVFNTLTLKQIFWKTQTFFEKLEHWFLGESTKIENAACPYKLLCQKPMLRKIEWIVLNGAIPKNGILPVTSLFFRKLCFNLRMSYQEKIWFTN